ncbi:MAG: hypothetical protein IRZ21_04390 [Thermoleophilaceae bacterium]|nr:hypothetical protein [Thermoleophilaceae bacterium]
MGGTVQQPIAHECRQCCAFCDRLVEPAGCIEAGCPYLYVYDDETGSRYMGCLNKVFRSEIDVALFEEAQKTRQGFGGVKMTGRPTSLCRVTVERAYRGEGEPFECVNPGFLDGPEPLDGLHSFDVRDRL